MATESMPKGIVLGGGGTLGDFQVGALTFLYEKGILPDITCVSGTSIGAINAVIVASGDGCDKRLQAYWSDEVIDREDLIPQHNWSEDVAPLLKAFLLSEKRSRPPRGRLGFIWRMYTAAGFLQGLKGSSLREVASGLIDLDGVVGAALRDSTLYTQDALKQRLLEKFDAIDEALNPATIKFCLYATNVETGEKTCFTNKKELIGTDEHTTFIECRTTSLLVQAALASAAVPVIFPPVKACGSYHIDGGAREVVPVKGAIACGARDIYAVLCLPRFENRRKYACVDVKGEEGGKVSVQWSTSNLLDLQPEDWVVNNRNWDPESDECDVVDIANRTTAILLDEITEFDLSATDKNGVKPRLTVIDPLIPVHGLTKLNVGLLKINADQGYMRAFDVLCAANTTIDEKCEQLTAVITVKRMKIWALEHQLIKDVSKATDGSRSIVKSSLDVAGVLPRCCTNVVDTTVLLDIREMKKELKECIDRRLDVVAHSSLSADDKKRCLPNDYECMYMCWEPHNWSIEGKRERPLIGTPWDTLDLGELGSDVIKADPSLGRPPKRCKTRSLLHFGKARAPKIA